MQIYEGADEHGSITIAEVDEKNLKIRIKKEGLIKTKKTNLLYVFETKEKFINFINSNIKMKNLKKLKEY